MFSNLFNRKPPEPEREPVSQLAEKAFDSLSAIISPEWISQVRSFYTADEARREGSETMTQTKYREIFPIIQQHLRDATFRQIESILDIDMPRSQEFRDLINNAASRFTTELTNYLSRVHPQAFSEKSPAEKLGDLILEYDPLKSAFRNWAHHYNSIGAIHHGENSLPSDDKNRDSRVENILIEIIAETISDRRIGETESLKFREIKPRLDRHAAIDLKTHADLDS